MNIHWLHVERSAWYSVSAYSGQRTIQGIDFCSLLFFCRYWKSFQNATLSPLYVNIINFISQHTEHHSTFNTRVGSRSFVPLMENEGWVLILCTFSGGQVVQLIMEYLPLGSLKEYLPKRKLGRPQALMFAQQICQVSADVLCFC